MTAPSDRAIAQAFREAEPLISAAGFKNVYDGIFLRAVQIDGQSCREEESIRWEMVKAAADAYLDAVADKDKGMEVDLHAMRKALIVGLRLKQPQQAEGQPGARVPDGGLLNVAGRQYLYDKASDSYVRNLDGQQPAQGDAARNIMLAEAARDAAALAAQAGGNGDG